jgi:hypothetical protein
MNENSWRETKNPLFEVDKTSAKLNCGSAGDRTVLEKRMSEITGECGSLNGRERARRLSEPLNVL